MKDLRDIKKEYGYILRWVNADENYLGRYYLENVKTKEEMAITNEDALAYISKKTVGAFRSGAFVYEVYVGLFEILGIEKKVTKLKEMRTRKELSQSALSKRSGVNLRTLQDYEQGKRDIDKAEALTVCKLANALGCNVEDLLETPLK